MQRKTALPNNCENRALSTNTRTVFISFLPRACTCYCVAINTHAYNESTTPQRSTMWHPRLCGNVFLPLHTFKLLSTLVLRQDSTVCAYTFAGVSSKNQPLHCVYPCIVNSSWFKLFNLINLAKTGTKCSSLPSELQGLQTFDIGFRVSICCQCERTSKCYGIILIKETLMRHF